MKNDDLEKLETSEEIQKLIRYSREQYEQEKLENPPLSFSSVMETIQLSRTNKTSRTGWRISPWWLTVACLLGCIIGYAFSSGEGHVESERLATVTDTLIVVHERVDTVYKEVQFRKLIANITTGNVVKPKASEKLVASHSKQVDGKGSEIEPDFISSAYLQQKQNMPNPESEYYAVNGMTVAEDNSLIHLLVSAPCK